METPIRLTVAIARDIHAPVEHLDLLVPAVYRPGFYAPPPDHTGLHAERIEALGLEPTGETRDIETLGGLASRPLYQAYVRYRERGAPTLVFPSADEFLGGLAVRPLGYSPDLLRLMLDPPQGGKVLTVLVWPFNMAGEGVHQPRLMIKMRVHPRLHETTLTRGQIERLGLEVFHGQYRVYNTPQGLNMKAPVLCEFRVATALWVWASL